MRRSRFRDEAGLAGKILVGVIAWALGAVLLLTNTLVAAQQIEEPELVAAGATPLPSPPPQGGREPVGGPSPKEKALPGGVA